MLISRNEARGILMARRNRFNPKRRICEAADPSDLEGIAGRGRYVGNPEHKRNPGDFGLTPPAQPRADKTLCDDVKIFSRRKATNLLKVGVKGSLISERAKGAYPQNIWAVTPDGLPLEAQLDNAEQGTYHGYPMPDSDPLREQVIELWKRR